MGIFSFFSKEKKETLDKGLSKTKENVFSKITRAIAGKSKVDDEVLDNLEEVLITSDVGVDTTLKIISRIEDRVARDKYVTTSELTAILREEIASLLTENHTEDLESFTVPEDKKPYVIMVVGVNGVGKTTTIGKLAYQLKAKGLKVRFAAADTFRAAAVEQLKVWGERTGCPVVSRPTGADAAGLVFDALTEARKNNDDVLFIDTAGRLQNKSELMEELQKIIRIIKKQIPDAPHACLQVLDATVGQNAHSQVKIFSEMIPVTGLVLTKLDGTAKGGICVAIAQELGVPVKYVGLGEGIDDLQPFNAEEYVKALI